MNIAFAILTAIALTVWDPAPLGSLDSLRGIEWVSVILDDEDPGIGAKEAGLTLELLRADVTAKLRAGGMKLEEGSASPQLGLLVAHLEYKAAGCPVAKSGGTCAYARFHMGARDADHRKWPGERGGSQSPGRTC
ncbi:MAG: hypothetical protein DMG08_19730 [Acidobacteria bacterium]|nr:MAG: hypothetical protein DMG08_19730 [Acidobacteriota bacterium]